MATDFGTGGYRPEYDDALEKLRTMLLEQIDQDAHIDTPDIMAFIDGEMTTAEADYVHRHVASCSECADKLKEMRDIDIKLDRAAARREGLQDQTRIFALAKVQKAQSMWRFSSFALAASLVIIGFIFRHAVGINHSLSQTASAKQREIDYLQSQLAHSATSDSVLLQQQNEKNNRIAQISGQVHHLQKQLTEVKKHSAKPYRTDTVAQRNEKGVIPTHVPRPPTEQQIARDTLVKAALFPLDRTVQVALAEKRLPLSQGFQTAMIGSGGLEMGEGSETSTFNVISPVGTNLLTDKPLFTWTPLKNAAGYTVVIKNDQDHVVAASSILFGEGTTHWQPAAPLPRGQTLHWSVTAQNGDALLPVAPDRFHPVALFNIFDEMKVKELKHQAASVADSPKALAVLYSQANLLDDAEREAQAWTLTDPESPVAQSWLATLRTYRQGKPVGGEKKLNE